MPEDRKDLMQGHMVDEKLKRVFVDLKEDIPEIKLSYLFGSQVEKNLGPLSDYDVALLLDTNASYQRICARVCSLLSRQLNSNRVDLICLNEAPVELAFSIISHNEIIFESDVQTRVEYESRVMNQYFDYLPMLKLMRQEIMKGGEHATRVQRYRETLGRTERTPGQIRALQGEIQG